VTFSLSTADGDSSTERSLKVQQKQRIERTVTTLTPDIHLDVQAGHPINAGRLTSTGAATGTSRVVTRLLVRVTISAGI